MKLLVALGRARQAECGALAQRGLVAELLSPALRLDPRAIERGLVRMRRPGESDEALARRCADRAAWLAGAIGLVLGLPDHPALAIPAALVEAVLVRRIERVAMTRIALLYQERMLREGLDAVGLLKAILGRHLAGGAAAIVDTAARRKAFLATLRRLTGLDTRFAATAILKSVGVKACGRTILVKAIPVIGAVAAGVAAAKTVRRETERVLSLLESPRAAEVGSAGPPAAVPISRRRGVTRRAAVEIVAAGIRAGDALAGATRGPRNAIAALLAEARARARRSSKSGHTRVAA